MILLAGATGLVGSALTRTSLASRLHLIGRRAVAGDMTQSVAPIEDWPALIAVIKPEIAISTLGTTIRQAGSTAAFHAIDHDLVLDVARAAKDAGARQFIMVSSVGASASSSNFYLKTKGEAESSVRALDFDRLDIIRPGLLIGDRGGPARIGERIAMTLSPISDFFTPQVLSQYRSTRDHHVAAAINMLCGAGAPGVHIHHNQEMLELAGERR
jgi:uncharacterized protein YbjT (DUF2867 family)